MSHLRVVKNDPIFIHQKETNDPRFSKFEQVGSGYGGSWDDAPSSNSIQEPYN